MLREFIIHFGSQPRSVSLGGSDPSQTFIEVTDPCLGGEGWLELWTGVVAQIARSDFAPRKMRLIFIDCALVEASAFEALASECKSLDIRLELVHIVTNRRLPAFARWGRNRKSRGALVRRRVGWRDIERLMLRAGWKVDDSQHFVGRTPTLFSSLTRLFPAFRHFARRSLLRSHLPQTPKEYTEVAIIVPVRNERDNLLALAERLPRLPSRTEIVIVEGGSSDDSWQIAQQVAAELVKHEDVFRCIAIQQPGRGKFDAVLAGFESSSAPVLAILDGDLAVAPEVISDFVSPVINKEAEVVVGDRLTLGMEVGAMRALNYAANLLLAKIVSRVAQRSVDDSLCGTKVLWRDDWHEIESRFPDLVGIDPFGDYSIIFGAAAIRRQILSVPTVYRARTYGETNILRFRDGLKLLRVISAWHRALQKQARCYLSY